jgi:hypothetical protein
MAAETAGHAPEVNQFYLGNDDTMNNTISAEAKTVAKEVDKLLTAAVMHLALLRTLGNKLGDESDTREYDYMVHPIFSAFFEFSYRRKRKMKLVTSDIYGLVKSPKKTIKEILKKNNRRETEPLPDQLLLFEAYYDSNS